MKIDKLDLLGGFILAAIGAFVLAQSFRYGLGTPRRMGAGYFPMVLGVTATLIGVLVMIRSIGRETTSQTIDWRPPSSFWRRSPISD